MPEDDTYTELNPMTMSPDYETLQQVRVLALCVWGCVTVLSKL